MSALVLIRALLLSGVILVLLAIVARRLLGLEVGWMRILFAAAVGYTIAGVASQGFGSGAQAFVLLSVLVGISVLITMVGLVVGEAVVPAGSRPVRDLRRRLTRIRRYTQITGIVVRHGLQPYLRGRLSPGAAAPYRRERLARSLRLALEEAGVTFVKLGQFLSTRRDLFPSEVTAELGRLREHATPAPWPAVRAVLAEELGSVDDAFAAFDPEPLAAASVAQVHAARLRSGEEVVVKVQRPGIARMVERDLDIALRIAGTIQARRRRGLSVHATIDTLGRPGLNTIELVHGFATAIREELDFRVEARNIAAARATAANGHVRVPAVHAHLSGRRVLVMERLDGVTLGTAGPGLDARQEDRRALARALLECLLRQITVGGVFHADPHPGNVLLLDDGRLGLLDFGSVGRLDAFTQKALRMLLAAIHRGDPEAVSAALLDLSQEPQDVDEQRFARAVGRFMARHLAPGGGLEAAMFADLFQLVAGYGLSIPPDAAGVFRALATLEGTLAALDPSFEMVAEARVFATAELRRAAPRVAQDELLAAMPMLQRLPGRLDHITRTLEQGRFNINVRLLADERDRRVITGLLHQVLLAFLAASIGIMAVLLLGAGGGPIVTANITLFQLLGYNLLVVSLLLILRVLVILLRPERPRHLDGG